MLRRLPERIEPIRYATMGRMLEGQVALAGMHRLAPSLNSQTGLVNAELILGVDDSGVRYLRGTISTELGVVCQRCMQAMQLFVDTEFALGLVTSREQADMLPEEYEPLIVDEQTMSLTEIIEDELILVMPIAPMHPVDECTGRQMNYENDPEAIPAEGPQNPFSVLKKLKSNRKITVEE